MSAFSRLARNRFPGGGNNVTRLSMHPQPPTTASAVWLIIVVVFQFIHRKDRDPHQRKYSFWARLLVGHGQRRVDLSQCLSGQSTY